MTWNRSKTGAYRAWGLLAVVLGASACSGEQGAEDGAEEMLGDPAGPTASEPTSEDGPGPNGTPLAPGVPSPTDPTDPSETPSTDDPVAGPTGEDPTTPGPEDEPTGTVPDVPGVTDPAMPTPTPEANVVGQEFTRLTRAELVATLSDALGLVPDMSNVPVDGRVGPFTSNALMSADPVHPYLLMAEGLAASAVPELLPACAAAEAQACLEANYRVPLERLFRRAVSDAELGIFAAMMQQLETDGASSTEATRAMLGGALLSPDFLFRASPANESTAAWRRSVEHLSYAIWDAPPDAELLELVTTSPADPLTALAAQAGRVARDARSTPVLARFVAQWLHLDTDDVFENDPDFGTSPAYLELLGLVADAVGEDVPVTELLAGESGFVHRDNAELYGVEESGLEGEVSRVAWPSDSPRRGLLGQDLFAASTRHPDSSRRPIFRGLLVRRSLLCSTIPAPSAELVALAGEVGDRTQDARCSTCHQLLDPIGQAFAALDPEQEGAAPEAVVLGQAELEGTYATLPELLEAIAASRVFAECFSKHWLGFFLELPLEELDATWVSTLADSVQAGASLGALLEQTTTELHTASESAPLACEGQ